MQTLDERNAQQRTYWHENKDRLPKKRDLEQKRAYSRRCREERKSKVMAAYGGRCFCCGEDRLEFLTIDHGNNDGAAHRASFGYKGRTGNGVYQWLIKHGFPDIGLRVACWNCNMGRQVNGGICPHQEFNIVEMAMSQQVALAA